MSELKACPFCGGVPKPKPSKDECWWHECGCRTVIINYEEWNTRPIEDELRAEIARLKNQVTDYLAVNAELVEKVESRDEKIAELKAIVNPASFRQFLVEQIKDPELAEAYVKACIQDTTYKELLARRDEQLHDEMSQLEIATDLGNKRWFALNEIYENGEKHNANWCKRKAQEGLGIR